MSNGLFARASLNQVKTNTPVKPVTQRVCLCPQPYGNLLTGHQQRPDTLPSPGCSHLSTKSFLGRTQRPQAAEDAGSSSSAKTPFFSAGYMVLSESIAFHFNPHAAQLWNKMNLLSTQTIALATVPLMWPVLTLHSSAPRWEPRADGNPAAGRQEDEASCHQHCLLWFGLWGIIFSFCWLIWEMSFPHRALRLAAWCCP